MTEVTLSAADRRACSRLSESVRHHLASIPEPPHSDRELIATLPAVGCLELRPALSRFVLVAEAEKIDIETMEWLCRSVSPDAKLVLLGDDEQLASIESGGAFKDLLHRSSSAIALKENRRRDPDEVVRELPVRERADAVRFEGVELLVSDGDGFLERWYEEHVRPPGELGGTVEALKPPFGEEDRATLGRLLNHFRRSRVLGWTRREASLWNERLDRSPWCRPVLGHPEGELGLSLGGSLFFPSHLRPRDVGLAYAETLRGSGGSSFDRAVVVLPAPDHPLLLRHFLASALSAGHQSVTLLGSHEAVLAAARTAPERSTGLAERLERH